MTNEQGCLPSDAYKGARWLRADLHLHSPGCTTFRLPDGMDRQRDVTELANRYVAQLVAQGIRVAAITDYQGPREAHFAAIRRRAELEGIAVFPGAEVAFSTPHHGLHVLAIFPYDYDTKLDVISRALDKLDRDASCPLVDQEGTHRGISGGSEPTESLRQLVRDTGAILIAPHPTDDNGLRKSYEAAQVVKMLRLVKFDAIECWDDGLKRWLLSTGDITREELDAIACVESSDPKSVGEIGTKVRPDRTPRATYLKLAAPRDLSALRLALHDPQVLVHVGAPPHEEHTHLSSLRIEGAGFLSGLELALSPDLSTLIGGRGVGKSALLETVRYALGLEPYAPTDYREELVRHALGSGGKVTLCLQCTPASGLTRSYRIERVLDEEPRVFELGPEQEVRLQPLAVLGDRQAPFFFGQREVYEVTANDRTRLRLLDEIIGRRAQDQASQVTKLEDALRANARRIVERSGRVRERETIGRRLEEIRHEVRAYEQSGVAEKLKQATALAADEERLSRAVAAVGNAGQQWTEMAGAVVELLATAREDLAKATSAQAALLRDAARGMEELEQSLSSVTLTGTQRFAAASLDMQALQSRWNAGRQPLDDEINAIKQTLGAQSLDPDRLVKLTREQASLEPQLRLLDGLHDELSKLRSDRDAVIGDLRSARREAWRLRSEEAKRITESLDGRVKVTVEYGGQREAYAARLRDFCQGSGADSRTYSLLAGGGGGGRDGHDIAQAARAGPDALLTTFGLSSSARAEQICRHVNVEGDESRLLELDLLAPSDSVAVNLDVNGTAVPLAKLSGGQRATAMLLLLLAQEERPLLVDQPEDDLDNRFVYDDIVQILRKQKGSRQLILATHNANIPVLGDAELIVELQVHQDKATVTTQGGLDDPEVREVVKAVMEGGEIAFQRRAEKYGPRRGG